MIEITIGVHRIKVTNGAFETIFKRQGFYPYFENEDGDSFQSALTEDEIFASELEEKPISQWNKDEVSRYATIKEIDLGGTRNLRECKARIRSYWDERDSLDVEGEGGSDDEWDVD